MPTAALLRDCDHKSVLVEPSAHAADVGYRNYTPQQLANAAGNAKKGAEPTTSFPRPLVLPGDDLSEDPRCPGQSFRSWAREPHRNEVTSRRNIVYVAWPPSIGQNVKMMEQWAYPEGTRRGKAEKDFRNVAPRAEDMEAYLSAFYTGMKVATLSPGFTFADWDEASVKRAGKRAIPPYIGLRTADEVVGIRARPCPDGMFKAQLNLNDIIDAAISALPDNAYALVLLVHQDLFEDEDDDFCCGRAYGGSRIAVVSSARYNPSIDEVQNVEREHAWPASHCEAYATLMCEASGERTRPNKKARKNPTSAKVNRQCSAVASSSDATSPYHAAVSAHRNLLRVNDYSTTDDLLSLWTARVCRTASHELGHCFGIAHCVYYACMMQSTASLAEDVRQPPHLCPVDLAKLLRATDVSEAEHYASLQKFCGTWSSTHMFAAFGAWAEARLVMLKQREA